jgi:hypothetical protein
MEELIKRKRGRPRKNSVPAVVEQKRPRGRPSKIAIEAPIAKAHVISVNAPRKQVKATACLGIEYYSETLKIDRSGNPAVTRKAKYVNGKMVMEMTYDHKKDAAIYKLKELV